MSGDIKEIIDPHTVEEIAEEIVSSMRHMSAPSGEGRGSDVPDLQIAELREKVVSLETQVAELKAAVSEIVEELGRMKLASQ